MAMLLSSISATAGSQSLTSLRGVTSRDATPTSSRTARSPKEPFEIGDYLRVQRIKEVALADSGKQVAYIGERQSVDHNRIEKTVFVQDVALGSTPQRLPHLADAKNLAWRPGTDELCFLANRTGTDQIYAYDLKKRHTRKISQAEKSIWSFRFDPKGESVAYTTSIKADTLYQQIRRDGPGILINTDHVGYLDFLDPNFPNPTISPNAELWLSRTGSTARKLNVPGDVQDMFWSSDGRRLSIRYLSKTAPRSMLRQYFTSVGVIDTKTSIFSVIAEARLAENSSAGTMYSGGEWIPQHNLMVIRRTTEANPWLSMSEGASLGLVSAIHPEDPDRVSWVHVDTAPSRVTPIDRNRLLLEIRERGRNLTAELIVGTAKVKLPIEEVTGSKSLIRFSADRAVSAYVHESLTAAPELYASFQGGGQVKLTSLNEWMTNKSLPNVRSIQWASTDGTVISGWLFTPDSSVHEKPWPLLTYVHGGPGYPFPDQFAPTNDNWPYPLEVLALQGVAIFIPQYRGTLSFGQKIARPSKIDGEPVEDILSGIAHLQSSGVADPQRLAIAGHSHGAWLATLIATRSRIFRAGSFSEGVSNQVMLYELYAGEINREVHERGMGEPSLYRNPSRYLELSPDLSLDGYDTASLFEGGKDSIHVLGMAKAAKIFRVPSEFVLYPNNGHALTTPRSKLECSQRNLDWFLFWLRGIERVDDDEGKQRSLRWRGMRPKHNATALSRDLSMHDDLPSRLSPSDLQPRI